MSGALPVSISQSFIILWISQVSSVNLFGTGVFTLRYQLLMTVLKCFMKIWNYCGAVSRTLSRATWFLMSCSKAKVRLWILHPWKYSKLVWTLFYPTCSRCSYLGPDDWQRPIPNLTSCIWACMKAEQLHNLWY